MNRPSPDAVFDHLVIGGGTAGCVLAARLSQRSDVKVLLVEAGADFAPGSEPASIRSPFPTSFADPRFFWPGLIAEVGADPGDGQPRLSRPFVQGRGIGGSSSIMGMVALRGLPSDYDGWRDLGATGWGWQDVLPYFKRGERDLDFDGVMHGREGPIPIRRSPRDAWPPFCNAFAEAAQRRGFAYLPDCNAQFEDGVSAVPMNNLPDRRVSTAMGYLDADVRRRPNLQIMANATAETLACQGRRVVGAALRTASGRHLFRAQQTTVCAGAIHTPTLLMRSGIGPAAALRPLGIEIVADLPGVGQNLQNHVMLPLAIDLRPHAWQAASLRNWSFSALRYSSNHTGCPQGDMQIVPMNKTAWHPLGRRVGLIAISVVKAFSRGEIALTSADSRDAPTIRMNLLDDARDFDRLVDGVRLALSMLAEPQIASLRNEVFLPFGGHANSLNRKTASNWIKSLVIRQVFGLSAAARRRILKNALVDPGVLLEDQESLRHLVRGACGPVHHVCGTCKIGSERDPMAVLDANLRVRGMQGLRVADASVMPDVVSANTHLPVVMIAEKAAQIIVDEPAASGMSEQLATP